MAKEELSLTEVAYDAKEQRINIAFGPVVVSVFIGKGMAWNVVAAQLHSLALLVKQNVEAHNKSQRKPAGYLLDGDFVPLPRNIVLEELDIPEFATVLYAD